MANPEYYIDHLEWEVLDEKVEIRQLQSQGNLYHFDDTHSITIFRDEDYKLRGVLTGKFAGNLDILFPPLKQGEMTSGEIVKGVIESGREYLITGLVVGTATINLNPDDPTQSKFTANISFDSLTILYDLVQEADKFQYWYLCAKGNITFPMQTQRTNNKQYPKQRLGFDKECSLEKLFVPGGSSNLSKDFLPIPINEKLLILSSIPNNYLPPNIEGLCFECRKSFGDIPEENEIKATAELLGFIFGSQLIPIGLSIYNRNDILKQISISPSVSNLSRRLKQNPSPPIDIHYYINIQTLISAVLELLPQYLEKRDILQLNNALSYYWIAKDSPVGVNLPILSSALEAVANASLRDSRNTEQQSTYMPAVKYRKLIKNEFDEIKSKLDKKGIKYKNKIANKIDGAYNMGGGK